MRPRNAVLAALGVVAVGALAWRTTVPEWPAWRALVVPVMAGACVVGYSLAGTVSGHGNAAALLCALGTFGFMQFIGSPWATVGYFAVVVPGLVLGVADMAERIRGGFEDEGVQETPA